MVAETDVAIIGMAGRFPGADDLDSYWRLLREGREGVTRFGREELAAAGVPARLLDDPGYVPTHGVIPDVDLFDTGYFEFTPAEAEFTDPQHRILLTTGHAALENAGYDPARFDGLISVYAGAAINTYLQQQVLPNVDQSTTSNHFAVMVGNDKDFLATRLAYKLDLKGPAYTVQTACSTSLVAIHLACQGLVNGECDMALAGGVTVKLPQAKGYLYEEGAILSEDGYVRTFDAEASGTVLGNGVGVLVLKLLRDAIADRDTVHAVIKGTATNNDGSGKVSFAAPGAAGQAAVIREAHAVSGVDPRTIGYVEAHGTATRLGDPVEVSALTKAFRDGTADTGFCAIGSVKSNIGHLDAAAGVAGVIKTVLMMKHRTLVPTVNYRTPNPAIDFASGPFTVSTAEAPWTAAGPLRAGVSSFGIGGTNAHAVLEEAPPAPVTGAPARTRCWCSPHGPRPRCGRPRTSWPGTSTTTRPTRSPTSRTPWPSAAAPTSTGSPSPARTGPSWPPPFARPRSPPSPGRARCRSSSPSRSPAPRHSRRGGARPSPRSRSTTRPRWPPAPASRASAGRSSPSSTRWAGSGSAWAFGRSPSTGTASPPGSPPA